MEIKDILPQLKEMIQEAIRYNMDNKIPHIIYGPSAASDLLAEHGIKLSNKTITNYVRLGKIPVKGEENGITIFDGPELVMWAKAGRPPLAVWMAEKV